MRMHLNRLLAQRDVVPKHRMWRLLRASRAPASLLGLDSLNHDIEIRLAMDAAQALIAVIATQDRILLMLLHLHRLDVRVVT